MKAMLKRTREFLTSEDGPTATEYAVMLAMIILMCAVTVRALGSTAHVTFKSTDDTMTTVTFKSTDGMM